MEKQIDDDDLQCIVLEPLSEEQANLLQQQEKERLQKFYGNNTKYQISYWYDKLKNFTFLSVCFSLTVHEAYILYCKYYEETLNEEDLQVQQKFKQKLNKIISSFQHYQAGVFMKLSTRSPKDYCWDYRDKEQAEKSIKQLCKMLKNQNIHKQSSYKHLNTILYLYFLLNSKNKLLIRNADDFIKIFGKSDRIIIDINDISYLRGNIFTKMKQRALTTEEKQSEFIKIWARQWQSCQWSQEFRVFYHDYKVTAITQYDQNCFFSSLLGKQQIIKQRVVNYFEKIKPYLEEIMLSQGVMDLMIKDDNIKLIEINVFNENARASLFNWKNERNLLQQGPLQVRFLKEQKLISKATLGSIMGMIDKGSNTIIEAALKQCELEDLWKNQ